MIAGFLVVLAFALLTLAVLGLCAAAAAGEGAAWEERDPLVGDLSSVPEDELTPIYDQRAAERVIASADAVVAEAWRRHGGEAS